MEERWRKCIWDTWPEIWWNTFWNCKQASQSPHVTADLQRCKGRWWQMLWLALVQAPLKLYVQPFADWLVCICFVFHLIDTPPGEGDVACRVDFCCFGSIHLPQSSHIDVLTSELKPTCDVQGWAWSPSTSEFGGGIFSKGSDIGAARSLGSRAGGIARHRKCSGFCGGADNWRHGWRHEPGSETQQNKAPKPICQSWNVQACCNRGSILSCITHKLQSRLFQSWLRHVSQESTRCESSWKI